MTSSIADLISALPDGDGWGPPVTTETTLDGVPYAPFSKGDKLGRMADWTSDGKDGRDGRGGRQQYNRNYRGALPPLIYGQLVSTGMYLTDTLSTTRPTNIRCPECHHLRRTCPRARRGILLRRLQRSRLGKDPLRPRRRLHPWRSWPARWCSPGHTRRPSTAESRSPGRWL